MKIKKIDDILNMIKENRIISVTDLQKELNIPRTSLLRYLSELEIAGHVTKTFGEVKIRNSYEESWAANRYNIHILEKKEIAKIAFNLVENNDTIFLDGGTTTLYIAKVLKDKNINIYTNNLLITRIIGPNYKPNIYFIPGKINKNTICTASIESIKYIEDIRFNKSFIGFNSLSDNMFATTNNEESFIKKSIISSTDKNGTYITGGSYKINTTSSQFIFAKSDKVKLITEKGVI